MVGTSSFNPFYPQGYAQQLDIQRQQAIADALSKQGAEPIQYDQRGAISPLQGVNKMAEALLGAQAGQQAKQGAIDYQQNYMQSASPSAQAMGDALASPGGSPNNGASGGRVPAGQRYPNGIPALFGDQQQDAMAFQQMGAAEYYKAAAAASAPTNMEKEAASSNPGVRNKATYIEPVNLRQGNVALDPITHKQLASAPNSEGLRLQPDGSMAPVPISSGQLPLQGPITSPPIPDKGPFGTNGGESGVAPISPDGRGAIPTVNGQPAPAALPQAPESATNLGTSINSPAVASPNSPLPATVPEYNALIAAQKAGATEKASKIGEATAEATSNLAKTNAVTKNLLASIDSAMKINSQVPYGPFGMAETQAELSSIPGLGKGRDAAAATEWNQLVGQNILSGLQTLKGLGRVDIPEVNQVIKTYGLDMGSHPDARAQGLAGIKALITNNAAAAQNNLSNLNNPNLQNTTAQAPVVNYPKLPGSQPAVNPQALVNELKRRGLVQ